MQVGRRVRVPSTRWWSDTPLALADGDRTLDARLVEHTIAWRCLLHPLHPLRHGVVKNEAARRARELRPFDAQMLAHPRLTGSRVLLSSSSIQFHDLDHLGTEAFVDTEVRVVMKNSWRGFKASVASAPLVAPGGA
jgi:hypothetical protein